MRVTTVDASETWRETTWDVKDPVEILDFYQLVIAGFFPSIV